MKQFSYLLLLSFLTTTAFAQNAPIDFEDGGNGADWVWTTFENAGDPPLEIIENPDPAGINTSATVAKFTALQAGAPFAGCESLIGAGIGEFTIDETNSTISIMVWKSTISDVGIKLVRNDFFSLGEIKVPNTKTNEWEQLEFDFSSHLGNTYHQIVIFPDFSARTEDQIVYFDNVYGGLVPNSTAEVEASEIFLFPNPVQDQLTISSEASISGYEIYAVSGKLMESRKAYNGTAIAVDQLPRGIYLLKAFVGGRTAVSRFVKE